MDSQVASQLPDVSKLDGNRGTKDTYDYITTLRWFRTRCYWNQIEHRWLEYKYQMVHFRDPLDSDLRERF